MDLLQCKLVQGRIALVATGFMAFLKFRSATSQVLAIWLHGILSTDLLAVFAGILIPVNTHRLEATLVVVVKSCLVMV